jgi:hypothetical protein
LEDTYEANIKIKDLPRRVDSLLNAIAAIQNRMKWEVVRDAMIEYAQNHRHELTAEEVQP